MSVRHWCELLIFVAGCAAFIGLFIFDSSAKVNAETQNNLPPAAESGFTENFSEAGENVLTEEVSAQDFSRFAHSNPMHARMPCLLCHRRSDNSPTMRYSGHTPCSGCHTQQFAEGNTNPICSICHTATGVKRFPTLRSFGAKFNHSTHTRQTNCATCHKPTQRGFTILSRSNSHSTCFQCHTANSENAMASCSLCHQPGRPPGAVSASSKAYSSTPFRHASHTRSMNCASCHTVKAGAARGRQVSAPLAAMHFAPAAVQSCASCHNNKRAFGGEDFSDCKRCHQGSGFRF